MQPVLSNRLITCCINSVEFMVNKVDSDDNSDSDSACVIISPRTTEGNHDSDAESKKRKLKSISKHIILHILFIINFFLLAIIADCNEPSGKRRLSHSATADLFREKFERKAELKEKEMVIRRMELEVQRRRLDIEEEERKLRLQLDAEERRALIELLKKIPNH